MERVKGIEPSLRALVVRSGWESAETLDILIKLQYDYRTNCAASHRFMASIYRKKNSPYWFVQYVDSGGIRRNKSTGLRTTDPGDTIQARALRAIGSRGTQPQFCRTRRRWLGHVGSAIPGAALREPGNAATLLRLVVLAGVLAPGEAVPYPRAITYRNALEYIDWRTNFKKKTGKRAGRNTAIMELKLLAMIMGEAVRLGHADANPLVSLKLRRDRPAKKPELTDREIQEIREALRVEPEWMQTVFDIALHTGCRLREARLPTSCLDFRENKITFPSPKGGEDRAFSVPMPSALRPLLERLARGGQRFTVEPVAAVLHQDRQAAFVLPLLARHLRQPPAPRRGAARSRHAPGESFVRIDPPSVPAREG